MTKPTLSIVTISFNQAEFLEEAIRSVVSQSRREDIEYIVVDAGSSDGSRAIIDRYREQIDQVILEPDQGPADGLNKGFAGARGEIFGFLNADDVLLPGAASDVIAFFRNRPEVDVVSGHTFAIGSDGEILRRLYSDRYSLKGSAYRATVVYQQSTFFRASAFKLAGGFNASNRVAWDGELYFEMALRGLKFELVNRFWSAFRMHRASITASERYALEMRRYSEEKFRRIMGREWRRSDAIIGAIRRFLKHVRNLRGLMERLRHGSIHSLPGSN